jgi:hypothetical protein
VTALFARLINYYQSVFYPIIDCLKYTIGLFRLRIPFSNDWIILYLLVGGSLFRFVVAIGALEDDTISQGEKTAKHVFFGIAFVLMWPLSLPWAISWGNQRWAMARYLFVGIAFEMLRAIGLFLLFVALNAASPSL